MKIRMMFIWTIELFHFLIDPSFHLHLFLQAYVDAVNTPKFQFGYANHAWLCLDLLEVLCQLAERGLAKSVRLLFEYALKHCPEVLLYGMAHVNVIFFSNS